MTENVKTEKNKIIKDRIAHLEKLKESLKTYLTYVETLEKKVNTGNKR